MPDTTAYGRQWHWGRLYHLCFLMVHTTITVNSSGYMLKASIHCLTACCRETSASLCEALQQKDESGALALLVAAPSGTRLSWVRDQESGGYPAHIAAFHGLGEFIQQLIACDGGWTITTVSQTGLEAPSAMDLYQVPAMQCLSVMADAAWPIRGNCGVAAARIEACVCLCAMPCHWLASRDCMVNCMVRESAAFTYVVIAHIQCAFACCNYQCSTPLQKVLLCVASCMQQLSGCFGASHYLSQSSISCMHCTAADMC